MVPLNHAIAGLLLATVVSMFCGFGIGVVYEECDQEHFAPVIEYPETVVVIDHDTWGDEIYLYYGTLASKQNIGLPVEYMITKTATEIAGGK